jgi:hypothetical protein
VIAVAIIQASPVGLDMFMSKSHHHNDTVDQPERGDICDRIYPAKAFIIVSDISRYEDLT